MQSVESDKLFRASKKHKKMLCFATLPCYPTDNRDSNPASPIT